MTNQRGVYTGPKYTREFKWDKLQAMTLSNDTEGVTCLLLPVENRQKTSGVLVGEHAAAIVGVCEVGVAIQRGTVDELIHELERELAELSRAR